MSKKKGRPFKAESKRIQLHTFISPTTLTIIDKLKFSKSRGEFIDFAVMYIKKALELKNKEQEF